LQIDDCTRHDVVICQGIGIFEKQTLQHKIVQGTLIINEETLLWKGSVTEDELR
jgi:hypothetical protein